MPSGRSCSLIEIRVEGGGKGAQRVGVGAGQGAGRRRGLAARDRGQVGDEPRLLPEAEQQRAGVEESVHHCLIKNTLLHPPKIAIEIKQPLATSN